MALTKAHNRMIAGSVASVIDFGADPTGSTDSTSAIQAAIDSFGSGLGTVSFPKGTYLVTSTLTIDKDRMNLVGEGPYISMIRFNPTADDICVFIGKGGEGTTDAGIIVQCSVRGLTFMSTDTTNKKTALELKDISLFVCEDVVIGSTTQWIGNGSIGVRVRGRELSTFSRMTVAANRPFVFARNTSAPSLCLDQFHFQDITTACRGHFESPAIYDETSFFFEPGSNFSNVTFDGFQSWNRGKNGLYYDNSTLAAAGVSYNLMISNVRWEGTFGDDDTGYFVYIEHGSVSEAQQVSISNCFFGEIGNGIYLKDFREATIADSSYGRNSGEALNLTYSSGNEAVEIRDCFWQTSSTATIPSEFLLFAGLKTPNSSPIARSGIYSAAPVGGGRRDFITGGAINQTSFFVAAADPTVVTLPISSTATVILLLTDSQGKFAIVGVNTVAKTTTLIYNDGTWSVTQGTAAKLNVYWDAGSSTYKLENKTGVSRDLFLQPIGSNR